MSLMVVPNLKSYYGIKDDDKTIYKTYAIDNASIVRMEAQGHSEKKVWNFAKWI